MESMLNPHCLLLSEPTFGRAKKIRVWINGDIANTCYDITLNPNVLRTWNSILQYLTHTINPQFGAVRKLICLGSKKAVTCFEELEATEKYIAMGVNSKLIILRQGYTSPSEQELLKPKKRRKKYYSGDMNSTNLQFLQDTKKRKLTVIYIVVNGQACQFPTKVVLNENDLINWNISLQFLTKILDVPEGIQHICTIFGDIVMDPLQLQHGFLYVALPFNAKFEKIDYMNTFGRASNKSSYVLKIRKRAQPIRVCCPIMKERTNKSGKRACTRKKCLKESDDERECSVLLPQEIPESCRLKTDEVERMEEETEKNKDCCLPNDKMIHLWCKLKRFKPGCCDKHDLADVLKKEQVVTKTRKKTSNASLGLSNKKKSYANGGKNDFNGLSPADLTDKDSAPTEESPENARDQDEEAAFGKKSIPKQQKYKDNQVLKPAHENNQQYEVIEGKLSLDSIEDSSSNINSEVLDQEVPQKNDQIVTYFSRVDNVPTKDRKPSISTTISRAVQTVADFSQSYPLHHVTVSSACLYSPVDDEEPTRLSANGGNENEEEDFAFIPIDSTINDKCVNTGISMSKLKRDFLSEKNSTFSQFTANIPYQDRKSKMNRGISAILSELNVYPNNEPTRMPSISIRNRTDINVMGYPKNGKRYRAEDVKNCYESSSASESPSMPECGNIERNDNLCCFCRGTRKLDRSISRISRSKHVSERTGGSEERSYSAGNVIEKATENTNFDKIQKDSNTTSTKSVSRNNSNIIKRDKLRSSKIFEEGSYHTDHIDKNIIPEKVNQSSVVDSNDTEVVAMPDIVEDKRNSVKQDSTQSKQSLPSRKNSRRSSTARAESEQDFPKRKSSKRESTDQNVEKIPEDGPAIAQSLKEIPIGNVDSKEPKQSSTRSSRRTSANNAVQLMKTNEDSIPYYDDLENGNVENDAVSIDSKQRQGISPRRKSSLRDSTSSSYGREKPNTSASVEKNDPKSISEEPQMKKCMTWRTGQKGKCRLRNSNKCIEDNVIPELDCEQSEESVLVRKTSRSDSYNKAISSVKKILEESMAEINQVLSNKSETPDENKADKGSSNHLAETQQDQSYSSASDDSLAFFP